MLIVSQLHIKAIFVIAMVSTLAHDDSDLVPKTTECLLHLEVSVHAVESLTPRSRAASPYLNWKTFIMR